MTPGRSRAGGATLRSGGGASSAPCAPLRDPLLGRFAKERSPAKGKAHGGSKGSDRRPGCQRLHRSRSPASSVVPSGSGDQGSDRRAIGGNEIGREESSGRGCTSG